MENLYTPHTPRKFFFSILCLCLLSWFHTIAQSQKNLVQSGDRVLITQNFKLEHLSTYEKSIKIFYYKKWKADRKEFEIVNKKEFWQYMPSVGLQFGLPSISWNPYQIFQARKDKEVIQAKLESIDNAAIVELNDQLLQMQNEHYKLQMLQRQLDREEIFLKMENQYFKDFIEAGFQAKTITPEDYRRQVLELKQKEILFEQKKDNFAISLFEFQKLAKYQLPNETFPAQEYETQAPKVQKSKLEIPKRGELR